MQRVTSERRQIYGDSVSSGSLTVNFPAFISSTRSSQILYASLDATTVLRVITPHDREGSAVSFHARHERAFLSRGD
jgi:NAD-dependent oxidoreductase involved in siderophore biosynthesis